MSSPTDPRTRNAGARRRRTVICRDDLYAAFEARARDLGCSVDWLLNEAMKRYLAEQRPRAVPPPLPPPPPRAPGIAVRVGDTRTLVVGDRFVIGRSARDANLVIKDPGVSRQHAILERGPGGWTVVDVASTNGVTLNGARVTSAPVRPGDILGVGDVTLTIERP